MKIKDTSQVYESSELTDCDDRNLCIYVWRITVAKDGRTYYKYKKLRTGYYDGSMSLKDSIRWWQGGFYTSKQMEHYGFKLKHDFKPNATWWEVE